MKLLQKHKVRNIAIASAILVVVILAVIYLVIAMRFKDRFLYHTTINGTDCSGMTVDEVKDIITQTITPYQIELTERDGQLEIIKSSDIDLHPVFDGSLEKELEAHNHFTWFISLFRKTDIQLDTMVAYDDQKFNNTISALQCVIQSDDKKPVDAHLSEYVKGKGYEIIPEIAGAQIDTTVLAEVLHTNISTLQDKISLEENNCYVVPAVTSNDETLVATCSQLNSYLKASITYTFGDAREVLDVNTFHTWLGITEDNHPSVDEEQATQYVKTLAAKYNTAGKTRSFTTTYGPTVQLSRNEYGWRINQEKETAQLLEDIKTGTAITREAIFSRRGKSFGPIDYGDTYVEINLTAQHLYMYKDGSLILESDIVSGNIADHATPPGAFSVTYTQKGAILRGPGYASPVDFWMPFNGGIGMHDATWKNDFGGNYYEYTGSHGCINMPYESAKTAFENIKAGDPVFVYKLPGTESEKYWLCKEADVVSNIIVCLGDEITLDSKPDIDRARSSYEALPDNVKPYVWPYDRLVKAEERYAALAKQQPPQGNNTQDKPQN